MSENFAIEIWPGERWDEVAHIDDLVYPPEKPITKVWRSVQWSHAERRVVISVGGEPVCHVGLYLRAGVVDGTSRLIAGIGGVMTHPQHQGRRYATQALDLADDLARKDGADFALLVCEPKNIDFYRHRGWRVFDGQMIFQQPDAIGPWKFSPVMVRDVKNRAPTGGSIDIRGLPW